MNRPMTAKAELFKKIQELSFVKTEIELFLDTHPESKVAMDYYKETVSALRDLMTKYQAEYGPITAENGILNDAWWWVDKPWPWQNDAEIQPREERK